MTQTTTVRTATPQPTRVVIVDDHEVVRIGLASSINRFGPTTGITVVAEARSVEELRAVLARVRCDVVVLDLALGDGSDPAETVGWLVGRRQPVLIYSIADDPRSVRRTLAAGAQGLSRKSEPIRETLDKILLLAAGQTLVSPDILAAIDGDRGFVEAKLSAREREVLVLYVSGLEVPQIAQRIYLTENSAKEYLRRIRLKYTGVERPAGSKVDLLRRAIEDGIVPPIKPR